MPCAGSDGVYLRQPFTILVNPAALRCFVELAVRMDHSNAAAHQLSTRVKRDTMVPDLCDFRIERFGRLSARNNLTTSELPVPVTQ